MSKEIDLFEVLGISNNEDSFTNLIKYMFDHHPAFKKKFARKFLVSDKIEKGDDTKLFIRTTYIPETNKRIIPNLVLYSRKLNQIAVIEVKIHAKQGRDQLTRYQANIDTMKEKVGLKEDASESYYYLSIERDIGKENTAWEFVSWADMGDLFDIPDVPDSLSALLTGVRKRIESLQVAHHFEEVKAEAFNNYLSWNLWKSPGKILKELLESHPDYGKAIEFDRIESFTQFAPAANTVETTLILAQKDWKSEVKYTDEKSTVNNCYDFHIEIRISIDPERAYLTIRLDHHFNPYAPTKTMKKKLSQKKYEALYRSKKAYIHQMKDRSYRN